MTSASMVLVYNLSLLIFSSRAFLFDSQSRCYFFDIFKHSNQSSYFAFWKWIEKQNVIKKSTGNKRDYLLVVRWFVTYFTTRRYFQVFFFLFFKACRLSEFGSGRTVNIDRGEPYDMPLEGGERSVNKIRVTIRYVASQSVYLLKYDSGLKKKYMYISTAKAGSGLCCFYGFLTRFILHQRRIRRFTFTDNSFNR